MIFVVYGCVKNQAPETWEFDQLLQLYNESAAGFKLSFGTLQKILVIIRQY